MLCFTFSVTHVNVRDSALAEFKTQTARPSKGEFDKEPPSQHEKEDFDV